MHLDLATILNLVSTLTLIGALVFTGLQVRQANRARREQAAITAIQTALSENSARMLDLFGRIPENAMPETIANLDEASLGAVIEFGIRLEVIGYMVFHDLVALSSINDLMGGVSLGFWARMRCWVEERRKQTKHPEFMEWCEWLAQRIASERARHAYEPAMQRKIRDQN